MANCPTCARPAAAQDIELPRRLAHCAGCGWSFALRLRVRIPYAQQHRYLGAEVEADDDGTASAASYARDAQPLGLQTRIHEGNFEAQFSLPRSTARFQLAFCGSAFALLALYLRLAPHDVCPKWLFYIIFYATAFAAIAITHRALAAGNRWRVQIDKHNLQITSTPIPTWSNLRVPLMQIADFSVNERAAGRKDGKPIGELVVNFADQSKRMTNFQSNDASFIRAVATSLNEALAHARASVTAPYR